jgi:predicted NUDIX family phosphoesterase
MNQVVIDKMQRKVMVVKNDVLFATNKRRNGLLPASENYEELILNNYEYMVRGEAEVNPLYKQPITYGVLVSTDKKVFVYKR